MTVTAPRTFGSDLRRLRERAGWKQAELAGVMKVARATFSQWETGRHLPSDDNVRELDRLLDAHGELQNAAESAREAAPEPEVRRASSEPGRGGGARLELRQVYDRLGRVMVDNLVRGTDGSGGEKLVGWRRDFRPDLPVSAFTTVCAIRVLSALPDAPYVDGAELRALVESFHESGGWATRGAGVRPETTAVAIDVLARLGAADLDVHLAELEDLIDPDEPTSTYVLAETLGTVGRLRPDSAFCRRLVRALLDARAPTQRELWPEKMPAIEGVVPQPSTAHTARAVIALRLAVEAGVEDDDGEIAQAVAVGAGWLVDEGRTDPVRENLEPAGVRDLEIRHPTPALVVRALSLAPDPSWPTIQTCLDRLWAMYVPGISRWTWPNGDVPVWLQHDAIAAIRVAADRRTTVVLSAQNDASSSGDQL